MSYEHYDPAELERKMRGARADLREQMMESGLSTQGYAVWKSSEATFEPSLLIQQEILNLRNSGADPEFINAVITNVICNLIINMTCLSGNQLMGMQMISRGFSETLMHILGLGSADITSASYDLNPMVGGRA